MELGLSQKTRRIFGGKINAIKWAAENFAEDFSRSSHVNIRHHHVREDVLAGTIGIESIDTKEMAAVFLNKLLSATEI